MLRGIYYWCCSDSTTAENLRFSVSYEDSSGYYRTLFFLPLYIVAVCSKSIHVLTEKVVIGSAFFLLISAYFRVVVLRLWVHWDPLFAVLDSVFFRSSSVEGMGGELRIFLGKIKKRKLWVKEQCETWQKVCIGRSSGNTCNIKNTFLLQEYISPIPRFTLASVKDIF